MKQTVTVSIDVAVDPETAFEIFTEEIDAWYEVGSPENSHDPARAVAMRIEPGVGGRVLELYGDDPDGAFEFGRVLVWEPGKRLVFEWRLANFAPDQRTEVEVGFEPVADGTRISLQHHGWDALPADHPAKHGLAETAALYMHMRWWAAHLTAIRRHVNGRAG